MIASIVVVKIYFLRARTLPAHVRAAFAFFELERHAML